jgi:hypothetical protein
MFMFCLCLFVNCVVILIFIFNCTLYLQDPEHPDHFFIDWDRGFTPDGRYLYLKKGKNPATGRKMGLEHSARRCAEIVRLGLASHVWMETPDANVADAKMFMGLVNESLAPHGVFARGLYNHSPSFVWDVSFFIESTQLAKEVAEYIETDILKPLDGGKVSLQSSCWKVKNFLKNYGDRVRGDYNFEVLFHFTHTTVYYSTLFINHSFFSYPFPLCLLSFYLSLSLSLSLLGRSDQPNLGQRPGPSQGRGGLARHGGRAVSYAGLSGPLPANLQGQQGASTHRQ